MIKRIGIYSPVGSSAPFRVANELCHLSTTSKSEYQFVKKEDDELSDSFFSNIDLFHLTVSPWVAPIPYLKWLHICKRNRIPTVTNIHGDYALEFLFTLSDGFLTEAIKEMPTIILSKYILGLSDFLVVNSKLMADRLVKIYGIDKGKIWVIANGVGPPARKSYRHEQSSVPKNRNVIIFTHGILSNRKGLPDVIHSIESLDRDDVLLQIAGEGPLASKISRYIKKKHLTEKVELLGYLARDQLIERISSADICIYPTKFDAFNIAVLEAMQYAEGVVLASKKAGVTGFFPDELSANTFDPTTSEISLAIERCIHLSQGEKITLQQAQQRFALSMSWYNIWNDYISMYDSICMKTGSMVLNKSF